ncbi:hypothetical protein F5Y15DRAFT_427352 [Xylariaceae sp. FL0016]|nr:hypothetical protein F5Y15DRAFT_427352 [Xylariaceae sp. FL0016]
MMHAYYQTQNAGASNNSNRASNRPPWQPTRAVGSSGQSSGIYSSADQTVDFAQLRDPRLRNGRHASSDNSEDGSCLSRLLGRPHRQKDDLRTKGTKVQISAPLSVPIVSHYTPRGPPPPRPARPTKPFGSPSDYDKFLPQGQLQTLTAQQNEVRMSATFVPESYRPNMALTKPLDPKRVHINPDRLGTVGEALGSHPIILRSQGPAQATPRERSPRESAAKSHNRRTVVYPGEDTLHITLKEPRVSADDLASRRRGRVFDPADLSKYHEFPNPANWDSDNGEQSDGQSEIYELVGDSEYMTETMPRQEGGTPRVESTRLSVPELRLIPPEEGDINQREGYLKVDDAYERLLKQSMRRERSLRNALRYQEPILDMLSKAMPNQEPRAAMEDLIDDRKQLLNLVPLVFTLACDRGIEPENYERFHDVLLDVLGQRDRAVGESTYWKRRSQGFESDLLGARRELDSYRQQEDEEDYVR